MRETILLKQQTPMWHFQAEQPGCCLRATEVKPKLDRFLLQKYHDDERLHKIGDTEALDYKLSFDVGDNKMYDLDPSKFTLYFGNMGDGPKKGLVLYHNPIKMQLFSLYRDMVELIKENLCEFFARNSFGTRQDKGFGYFFPEGMNFNQAYGAKYKIKLELSIDSNPPKQGHVKDGFVIMKLYEEMFKYIEYFHKLIRSGINENRRVYDSMLKGYAQQFRDENGQNIIWDKPLIRYILQYNNKKYQKKCDMIDREKGDKVKVSDKMGHEHDDCEQYRDNKGHLYLFREMLGLATTQEWKFYENNIEINSQDSNFTRFKSPINYRPCFVRTDNGRGADKEFEVNIFIDFDEKPLEDIKKQVFDITSDLKMSINHHDKISNARPFQKFSLEGYFDFIYKQYCDFHNPRFPKFINGTTAKPMRKKGTTKKADEYINEIFNPFSKDLNFVKLNKD